MIKIGLTGGIGSGKTAVANIFDVLSIPVFDADKQAKSLMETDEKLVSSIKAAFGESSFLHGKLNRPYLANIVFTDPAALEVLNALVHPATMTTAEEWMNNQKTPYVVKEAALLFEAGSAAHLDFVIGVYAPAHLRIKRVMDRDGVAREQILLRMNRQIDESIKMKLCDFVVVNDDLQLLIPQVLQLHQKFLEMAKGKLNRAL